SLEPQQWGTNIGIILSNWDRQFGTSYPHSDEYPETGVADNNFPWEHSIRRADIFLNLWRQFLYPFQRLFQR
ncbi:MAG: hypothetical protein AB7O65_14595, partial [Candidatus Korobacteraceae bacterium]